MGDGEDDVAVGLFNSDLVLTSLSVDTLAPSASLITPVAGTVNTGVGNQIVVEFSELVRNGGANGNYSVTNPNAWHLTEAGSDGVFGTIDDVAIPFQSVSYSSGNNRATATLASALGDGIYRKATVFVKPPSLVTNTTNV